MSVSPAFQIKRNDTLPVISAVLSTAAGPINLTGAQVYLVLTPVQLPQCGIQWGSPSASPQVPKVRGLCAIVGSPALGTVQYNWAVGDTSISGNYLAEFEIDISGSVQTVPTVGYVPVQIISDLG